MNFLKSRLFVYGGAAIAIVAIILLGRQIEDKSEQGLSFEQIATSGKTEEQTVSTARNLLGGPFTLVDHTGKTVSEQDFRGKFMLVFFGYTYCPDVCPTNLQTVADALDMMDPKMADEVVPVFITVDPERDTPEALADYVTMFHPDTVGLTGTPEQVRQAAKAWRVYYAKTMEGEEDGTYLMDHSAFTYLMAPNGDFVRHFPHGYAPDNMARRLEESIKAVKAETEAAKTDGGV